MILRVSKLFVAMLLFLGAAHSLAAQAPNLDSLELAAAEMEPSYEQWATYRTLLRAYVYTEAPQSRRYGEQMLELAQQLSVDSLMALSYADLGMVYVRMNRYEECIQYSTQALQLAQELRDTNLTIRLHINTSSAHFNQGNDDLGNQSLLRAKDLIGPETPRGYRMVIYNNLGSSYQEMGAYGDAIGMFEEARRITDPGDIRHRSMLAHNTASAYLSLQEYGRAAEYAQLAINLARPEGLHDNLASGFRVLAKSELQMDNAGPARRHLDSMIVHCGASQNPLILSNCLEARANLLSEMGDHKGALRVFREYVAFNDSIDLDAQTERIEQLQNRLELQSMEAETEMKVAQLKLERQTARFQYFQGWVIGIAAGGLGISIGIFIWGLLLRRQALRMRREQSEKFEVQPRNDPQ